MTASAPSGASGGSPKVRLSQNSLYFPAPTKPHQLVENHLVIYNLESAMVLYKVRTSAPENFSVKPRVGVLHPKEECKVKISFVGKEGHPRPVSTDRFSIECRFVDPAHDDTNNPEGCWPRHGEKLAESDPRAKMPITKFALVCDTGANGVPAGLVASEVVDNAASAGGSVVATARGVAGRAAAAAVAATPAGAAPTLHTPRTVDPGASGAVPTAGALRGAAEATVASLRNGVSAAAAPVGAAAAAGLGATKVFQSGTISSGPSPPPPSTPSAAGTTSPSTTKPLAATSSGDAAKKSKLPRVPLPLVIALMLLSFLAGAFLDGTSVTGPVLDMFFDKTGLRTPPPPPPPPPKSESSWLSIFGF